MKESCWEKVILSWANALQLNHSSILDISDLSDGSFLVGLLKQLGQDIEINPNANKIEVITKFIEKSFPNVKLKTTWDNNEVNLIASLLLLTSSLEVNHLRAPLYSLSTDIQLHIQAFIEKFVSVPKNVLTRKIIAEAIASISVAEESDDQEDNTDDPLSFVSSPNSSFTTLIRSPDPVSVSKNKVKKLECEVEILNLDKLHLLEELAASRQDVSNLDCKLVAKDQQLLHLKNELFLLKNSCNSNAEADEDSKRSMLQNEKSETVSLKDDLSFLQAALLMTKNELDLTLSENKALKRQLTAELNEKEELKRKNEDNEFKLDSLSSSIEMMESKISMLKTQCLEQDELLREKGSIRLDDDANDEACLSSTWPAESLASVVDLKYAELQEETQSLRMQLAESEAKLADLQDKMLKQESAISKQTETKSIGVGSILHNLNDLVNSNNTKLQTVFLARNLRLNKHVSFVDSQVDTAEKLAENGSPILEKVLNNLKTSEESLQLSESKLSFALNESEHFKNLLDLKTSEVEDLQHQLKLNERLLAERDHHTDMLNSDIAERILEIEQLREKLSDYEQSIEKLEKNLKDKDSMLNELKSMYDSKLAELDSSKNELCAKASLVAELNHDVQMCKHEKIVLEKKIDNILKEYAKNENHLKRDLIRYEDEIAMLKKELEDGKAQMKLVQDQVALEENLNNAFDAKLTELQVKMRQKFEKELSETVEEYKEKINKMKLKITKDKLHIQELSEDLWNTTDRLLLSQQQGEALRNQLRRTKCALEILNNSSGRRHSLATSATIQRASNAGLWLQPEDNEINRVFDEPTTSVTRNGIIWQSISDLHSYSDNELKRRYSLVHEVQLSKAPEEECTAQSDEQDEVFNDAFLQDLKSGICRVADSSELMITTVQRASCPPIAKEPESPVHMGKVSDRQVLIPPEKPKRKGQIVYSKPGPPTPCRTAAARLSLPHFERPQNPALRKLKENQISIALQTQQPQSNSASGSSRLSRLFSQNKTKPLNQESPKLKKKSFFQRKFRSNRENLPPPS